MKLNFKIEQEGNLFIYTHVDNVSYESMAALETQLISYPDKKAINTVTYNRIFDDYIAFVAFCFGKLDVYAIVNYAPDIDESSSFHPVGSSYWDYRFLADDYQGMGVDLGFFKPEGFHNTEGKGQHQVSALTNVLSLRSLPEEVFGEAVSNCTLFGLSENRASALQSFLQADAAPVLAAFLQPDEIFIHLAVAKQVGYYNALLIKSKMDMAERINAFQNILDPNN